MKMEFIFDKEKLDENGFTEKQCFDVIRRYFAKRNRFGTIAEISDGVFEGSENDHGVFGAAVNLAHSSWFLKVIKEWYWYVDEEDGRGEQKEDCLAACLKYAG